MGNAQGKIPQAHVRMYENLLAIQSPGVRAQMIQTMISSPDHMNSMRVMGIYGHLLHYNQVIQAGGAAPPLPYERGSGASRAAATGPLLPRPEGSSTTLQVRGSTQAPQASQKGNDRAMNYFSACLRILELEEEVALTEVSLKSAYKKAVIRAHPDKGGTEKEFEAVTRAYAYLGEILKRIHGGRGAEGKVEAPTALEGNRAQESDRWKMVEPVSLNPNKLDANKFNAMFEKTRIPDPEESGYGDWLKGEDSTAKAQAPKFSGKFNRDVFHRAFEDESRGKASARPGGAQAVMTVQEQSLASRLGYATELGRGARDDYTVSANDPGLKYTDLKKAYTEYNTFSQETSGVNVKVRNLDEYSQERDRAPAPLADHEMAALVAAEKAAAAAEEKRKLRHAQESVAGDDYFERMKRLVIRN
jgi:curved DNA-binding protein CbpA